MTMPVTTALTCHSETYSQAIQGIEARVGWTRDGALALTYTLTGDLTCLRIPPPRPPRRTNRLWQHTCFEAFVSVKGKAEYYEFNCAPSGDWAAYSFSRYRDGTPLGDNKLAPRVTARALASRLDLDAIIRVGRLPTIPPRAWLRLALSAVIEDASGVLSYWALKHPPGEPDFHHPDAFVLDFKPFSDVDAFNDPAYTGNQ